MKIIDVPQGSPEWLKARLGLPTASQFHRIVTPTGKPSAQADRYLADLAAEWFLGEPIDDFKSGYMERGTGMEAEARAWYAFETDADPRQVGLCLTDDGIAGASPDSLVGDNGLLEIKCPGAGVQMMYRLGGMPPDYFVQVQGQLWVTGRKWCDLLAFNPVLPKVKIRYQRDEDFIATLNVEVQKFSVRLAKAKAELAADREAMVRAADAVAVADGHDF